MNSILDVWWDSEFTSDFDTIQSLHYFFCLVLNKENRLIFTVDLNLKRSQFLTSEIFSLIQTIAILSFVS